MQYPSAVITISKGMPSVVSLSGIVAEAASRRVVRIASLEIRIYIPSTQRFVLVGAPWWMPIAFHLCLSTSDSKDERAGKAAYNICGSVVPRQVVHMHHSLVEQPLVLAPRSALSGKPRLNHVYTPWGIVLLRGTPRSIDAGHALTSAVIRVQAVIEIWRCTKTRVSYGRRQWQLTLTKWPHYRMVVRQDYFVVLTRSRSAGGRRL